MTGTVARAFEIARSGTCKNLQELRRQLKTEGCPAIDEHLSGQTIKKQLATLLRAD